MIIGLQDILEIEAFTGQKSIVAYIIEVTEFNFDIRIDLRGHMEANIVSEATIMAIIGDIPYRPSVIDIACLKFGVHFDI